MVKAARAWAWAMDDGVYLRNGHRFGGYDFAHLLEAQRGDVRYRVPLLPSRHRLHLHQHREGEHYQEEHIGNLQGGEGGRGVWDECKYRKNN